VANEKQPQIQRNATSHPPFASSLRPSASSNLQLLTPNLWISNRQLETIRNGRNPFEIRQMTFSNRPKKTGPIFVSGLTRVALATPTSNFQPRASGLQKAKKRLMETYANSKNPVSHTRQKTSHFLIETINPTFRNPASPRPNSSAMGSLWNLKSGGAQNPRLRLLGTTLRHRCHLFMTPGKTNSGLSTSKKAVRVLTVPEVYTPGRFLRRYL
jgi:hypothetical protein